MSSEQDAADEEGMLDCDARRVLQNGNAMLAHGEPCLLSTSELLQHMGDEGNMAVAVMSSKHCTFCRFA